MVIIVGSSPLCFLEDGRRNYSTPRWAAAVPTVTGQNPSVVLCININLCSSSEEMIDIPDDTVSTHTSQGPTQPSYPEGEDAVSIDSDTVTCCC